MIVIGIQVCKHYLLRGLKYVNYALFGLIGSPGMGTSAALSLEFVTILMQCLHTSVSLSLPWWAVPKSRDLFRTVPTSELQDGLLSSSYRLWAILLQTLGVQVGFRIQDKIWEKSI